LKTEEKSVSPIPSVGGTEISMRVSRAKAGERRDSREVLHDPVRVDLNPEIEENEGTSSDPTQNVKERRVARRELKEREREEAVREEVVEEDDVHKVSEHDPNLHRDVLRSRRKTAK
jgi:hypothetical protein